MSLAASKDKSNHKTYVTLSLKLLNSLKWVFYIHTSTLPLIIKYFLVEHTLQVTGQSFRAFCVCKLKAINILDLIHDGKITLVEGVIFCEYKPVPDNPWVFIFHLRTVYFPLL